MARIKLLPIIGIYKITSPVGRVYIGQSWNIAKRKGKYSINKEPRQRFIYHSINKYGWEAHKFEIIHELPPDVTQDVLDTYEVLYWQLYTDCGVKMLNIREPGRGGRNSEETKKRMSENNWNAKHKGELSPSWGKKHTPEHIEKCASKRRGKLHSMFGKFGKEHQRYGVPQPDSFLESCRKKVIDTRDNTVFPSVQQAADYFKVHETTLCKYLKGKLKNTKFPFLEYYKPNP